MAHGRTDRTSRRAEIPPPEEAALRARRSTKGGRPPPAAAELAGELRREGLLHQNVRHDARREQVQRRGAQKGFRRGQRRAVQQGVGIALVQTAHDREAAVRDGDAGNTTQRISHAGVAGEHEIVSGQDVPPWPTIHTANNWKEIEKCQGWAKNPSSDTRG